MIWSIYYGCHFYTVTSALRTVLSLNIRGPQGRIREFFKGGGQGPPKGRSVRIFKLTSNKNYDNVKKVLRGV